MPGENGKRLSRGAARHKSEEPVAHGFRQLYVELVEPVVAGGDRKQLPSLARAIVVFEYVRAVGQNPPRDVQESAGGPRFAPGQTGASSGSGVGSGTSTEGRSSSVDNTIVVRVRATPRMERIRLRICSRSLLVAVRILIK